jgi:regulator of replication initiation timing
MSNLPPERNQDYILLEEGQKMSENFNNYLNTLSMQIDELRKQNKVLYEKFEKESLKNDSLRSSIAAAKLKISDTEQQILLKTEVFNIAREKLNKELEITEGLHNINIEYIDPNQFIKENYNDVISKALKLSEYYSKLTKVSVKLATQEEILNKMKLDINKKLVADIKCVNCGVFYAPKNNTDESCIFHPGHIRYFSCRGCGNDSYYECCSKCKTCCKGCKVTHHSG